MVKPTASVTKITAIFLFIHDFSYSQNTVCFTIEDNPDINSPAFSDFTKYVRVLDCFDIYAESSIPDAKVLHAASIVAELLDNNEDGEVDDPLLKDELNANGALIPIFAYDGSPAMDNFFDKGLEKRKATLGKEYVENNLANADDFTLPFQEAMTSWCWGFGWGDETIDPKTRSMMNLSMIGALGKMHEWEIHCRGAITNGVTKDEIRAIIKIIVAKIPNSWFGTNSEKYSVKKPIQSTRVVPMIAFPVESLSLIHI